MAFIPLPKGVRVAMEFTKNGQLVVNVYHVISDAPLVTANLNAIAAAFQTWWATDLGATQVSALALVRVIATAIDEEGGAQGISTPTTPIAGSVSGTDTPNNVAAVVTHLTGRVGRSYRGRTYLAGLLSSEVSNDAIPSGRVAGILAAYAALNGRILATQSKHHVVSYVNNGVPRTTAISSLVTGYKMNTRVDTQRRRLPGTGA